MAIGDIVWRSGSWLEGGICCVAQAARQYHHAAAAEILPKRALLHGVALLIIASSANHARIMPKAGKGGGGRGKTKNTCVARASAAYVAMPVKHAMRLSPHARAWRAIIARRMWAGMGDGRAAQAEGGARAGEEGGARGASHRGMPIAIGMKCAMSRFCCSASSIAENNHIAQGRNGSRAHVIASYSRICWAAMVIVGVMGANQ